MIVNRLFQCLLGLLVVVVLACFFYWNLLSLQQASLLNGASFEPVECWFKTTPAVRSECGYMTTRHDSIDDATFKLPVVVLRNSYWKNSPLPMLHISGGPGGAAYLDAETMPYLLQNFQNQNWGVDFVLYDQRGTGLSQPFLDCPDSRKARLASLLLPLTASEDSADFTRQMRLCYEGLAKKPEFKAQMGAISTKHSAEDIADLHELLGVKQWILMGVSYGTRLALDVIKRFPEKVHSMVLDSVYPPEFDGFETMVENGFKGIDKLLNHCERDTVCETVFPDLFGQFHQALTQLKESQFKLLVPREGSSMDKKPMSLTAHRLVLLLDYASYDSALLKEIPAAIEAVLSQEKDNKSLLKLASNYLEIELFIQFSEPVYMITECRENGRFDMTALLQRLQPYVEEYAMLDWSSQAIFNPLVCKHWLDDLNNDSRRYREPVTTDKPTLILSGGLDSITPPEWGEHLSKILPNSRYLEYPNVGHSVLTSSLCANDEVQLFLRPDMVRTAFCNSRERKNDLSDATMNWTAATN